MMAQTASASAWIAIGLMFITSSGILLAKRPIIRAVIPSPIFAGWACLGYGLSGRYAQSLCWLALTMLWLFVARSVERSYLRQEDR